MPLRLVEAQEKEVAPLAGVAWEEGFAERADAFTFAEETAQELKTMCSLALSTGTDPERVRRYIARVRKVIFALGSMT